MPSLPTVQIAVWPATTPAKPPAFFSVLIFWWPEIKCAMLARHALCCWKTEESARAAYAAFPGSPASGCVVSEKLIKLRARLHQAKCLFLRPFRSQRMKDSQGRRIHGSESGERI